MIVPTYDHVLVEADKPPEKTAAGIFITEEWKTLPPTGTVKAIGPGVTTVKVGDRILFERYASIILTGEERLCKESHILAVINE